MTMTRETFWRLGEWIAGLPCRYGFHDFEPWRANRFRGRVWQDWDRRCTRCDKVEWLAIGENPPGLTHPGPQPSWLRREIAR